MTTTELRSWADKKLKLKKEIIRFFHESGATKEQIIEAAKFISKLGEVDAQVSFEYDFDDNGQYIKDEIATNFRESVREDVYQFCVRASLLNLDALKHLETQRPWKKCTPRGDYEYEDCESLQPSAEVIISPDKVYVHSLKFVEGLAESLGNSFSHYLSNGKWEFPHTKRAELEELGYPVLYYPGVGGAIAVKFDPAKFTTEKVGFEVGSSVFNVSEGWGDEDDLTSSPLWRYGHSVAEFRAILWAEIKKYSKQEAPAPDDYRTRGFYYSYLIRLAKLVRSGRLIKLLYTEDREHALLIKRCVYFLAQSKERI